MGQNSDYSKDRQPAKPNLGASVPITIVPDPAPAGVAATKAFTAAQDAAFAAPPPPIKPVY